MAAPRDADVDVEAQGGLTRRRHVGAANNIAGEGDTAQLNNEPVMLEGDRALNVDETLSAFFSKGPPVVDVILVLSFFLKMQHIKVSGRTAMVYLVSLALSFCMHVVGLSSSQCIPRPATKCRAVIAYLSTVLRMLGAAALLLLLDYGVHSVAVLAPFLLALALVAVLWWNTFHSTPDELGLNWGDHREELKLRFDLSANVVYMASAGLLGRVGGALSRRRGFMAMAPEYFLFYGLILGLMLLLHCTVPSHVERTRRIPVVNLYKPILTYAALLLVVLASVVAAEDILEINVFFVLFGIMTMLFFVVRRNQQRTAARNGSGRREQEANLSKYLLICCVKPLFVLVMATHSKHYSIQDASSSTVVWSPSFSLKCLLFWGLGCVLIYVVRTVVFAEMPEGDWDRSYAAGTSTYATYVAMAITGVCLVIELFLESGELKNILLGP